MIRRPPRSTQSRSSAASDVYKRQAFDAVCHDFYTIILEDLSAAFKREIHENTLNAYRNSAIYPIFKVMKSSELLKEIRPRDL